MDPKKVEFLLLKFELLLQQFVLLFKRGLFGQHALLLLIQVIDLRPELFELVAQLLCEFQVAKDCGCERVLVLNAEVGKDVLNVHATSKVHATGRGRPLRH